MATTEVWDNDDGLVIKFGVERSKRARAGEVKTSGPVHVLTMDLNYAQIEDNSTLGAGFDVDSDAGGNYDSFSGFQAFIPANALVISATFFALTDWADSAGTMDIDVGVYQKDGTVIDADGLIANMLEAALDAGDLVVGAGALIAADVGTNDAYIVIDDTGDATLSSGTGRLVIEYIPQLA